MEVFWIAVIGRENLCNLADGGIGGKRQGAGRPAGWTKVKVNLSIDSALWEELCQLPHGTRSQFVEDAVRHALKVRQELKPQK